MLKRSIITAAIALAWPATSSGQEAESAPASSKTDQGAQPSSILSAGRLDIALFRRNAEAAIKSGLIDPASAQIEWPYGFTQGTWKPFLRKRVSGYLTCGRVNAKNRMGGYVGSTAFVVVLDASGNVLFKDIGDGSAYDLVEGSCQKSVGGFPPPQPELLDRPPAATGTSSLADQLAKLSELKASGALTPEEFEAAKKKLLAPGS
jgi:hypothetical protein